MGQNLYFFMTDYVYFCDKKKAACYKQTAFYRINRIMLLHY